LRTSRRGCTPSVENPPPIIKAAVTVNPLAVNPVVETWSSKHLINKANPLAVATDLIFYIYKHL
jgi:hypothetical protein